MRMHFPIIQEMMRSRETKSFLSLSLARPGRMFSGAYLFGELNLFNEVNVKGEVVT